MTNPEDVRSLAKAITDEVRPFPTTQKAVRWRTASWEKWLRTECGELEALAAVKNQSKEIDDSFLEIDRDGVKQLAEAEDALATFVASQVWGHGPSGYGPYRVAVTLGLTESPSQKGSVFDSRHDTLERAQRLCLEEGGVEAYRFLVNEGKLPLLGPAFLTKYLFFVGSQPLGSPRPLVLDAVVRKSIEKHARDSLARSFGRTEYYESYLALVEGVVGHLSLGGTECSAEDVELALFQLGKKM